MSEYARRIILGSLVAFIVAVSIGAGILYLTPGLTQTSTRDATTMNFCCPPNSQASSYATTLSCVSQLIETGCQSTTWNNETTPYSTTSYSGEVCTTFNGSTMLCHITTSIGGISTSSNTTLPNPSYVIRIWLSQYNISQGQSVYVNGNFTNTSTNNQSIKINIVGPTLYPTVYFQNGTVAWSWMQNYPTQSQWEYTVAAGQTISLSGSSSSGISSTLAGGQTYIVNTTAEYTILTPNAYGTTIGNVANLTVT
jgi:hypothetical protein